MSVTISCRVGEVGARGGVAAARHSKSAAMHPAYLCVLHVYKFGTYTFSPRLALRI